MKILIAVDRSEYAEIVVEHGLDHAVRAGDGELHFVTAVEDEREIEPARRWLEAAIRDPLEAFGCADRKIELHVLQGEPTPVIASVVTELAPDVLVIGRFHAPSASDVLVERIDCPTLVVGIEGTVLEPQCRACRRVRRDTGGERLFCAAHLGDYLPDLLARLPPSSHVASRLW